jgi:hypothetical protein
MRKTKRLQVLLPEGMHQKIKIFANTDGISVSELVRRMIMLEISRRSRDISVGVILESAGDGFSLTDDLLKERTRDLDKEESKGSKLVSDLVIEERNEGY